jgi:hypothetical protein
MMKYVTDLSFNEDDVAQQAEVKQAMPIFKYFNEVKSHVPCIVIADSGMTWKSPGLGFDQGTFRGEDRTVYRVVHVMRQLNITFQVVAMDQTTADSISDCLGLVFGDLGGITSGLVLSDMSNSSWVVRLPKMPELGSSEKNQRGDDPKDLLWMSTSTVTVDYEDSFTVPFIEPTAEIKNQVAPARKFSIPQTVRVGHESDAFILNMRVGEDLSVSDSSCLLMKPGRFPGHYILVGRKPGQVKVRLLDGGTSTNHPGGIVRPDFTNEFTITVAY